MITATVFLPLLGAAIAGLFGRFIGDRGAQIITCGLLLISAVLAGLILLVAMIGTILLTLRTRTGSRRQNISRQVDRRVEDTLEIRKVQSGGGI